MGEGVWEAEIEALPVPNAREGLLVGVVEMVPMAWIEGVEVKDPPGLVPTLLEEGQGVGEGERLEDTLPPPPQTPWEGDRVADPVWLLLSTRVPVEEMQEEGVRDTEREAWVALMVGLPPQVALADRVGVPGALPLPLKVLAPLTVPPHPAAPALALAVAHPLPDPEEVGVMCEAVEEEVGELMAVPDRVWVWRGVEVGDWVPLKLPVGEPVQGLVGEWLEEEVMEEVVDRQAVGVLESVAMAEPVLPRVWLGEPVAHPVYVTLPDPVAVPHPAELAVEVKDREGVAVWEGLLVVV